MFMLISILLYCCLFTTLSYSQTPGTLIERADNLEQQIPQQLTNDNQPVAVDELFAQYRENIWTKQFKKYMPPWTGHRIFVLKNGQWVALFFIIFLCLIIERIVSHTVRALIKKFTNKYKLEYAKVSKKGLTMPFGIMATTLFWMVAINVIELPNDILSVMIRIGYVLFTVSTVFAIHRLVDAVSLYFQKLANESENTFDDILVPIVNKTLKFFVIIIGAIFIGESLTFNMKGIIAGLGIGGFAFALAAKDTISNIFGSITVLLDRPFNIGDLIIIDGSIEGIVEEVGLRTTKIRTFYDSLISLPNGKLINVHIDNYGQRIFRRFKTMISVQYDTPPEKIEAFCEGIRHIIINHKWTRKDYFQVYLNEMAASSLDILLYVYWQVPDWSTELAERHRLLIDVLRLGKELEIEFAFPTQTVHMYQEEKEDKKLELNFRPYESGKHSALKVTEQPITKPEHRSDMKIISEDTN